MYEEYLAKKIDCFPVFDFEYNNQKIFKKEDVKAFTIDAIQKQMPFEEYKEKIDALAESNQILMKIFAQQMLESNKEVEEAYEKIDEKAIVTNYQSHYSTDSLKEKIRQFNLIFENYRIPVNLDTVSKQDLDKAKHFIDLVEARIEFIEDEFDIPVLDEQVSEFQQFFSDKLKNLNWNNFNQDDYNYFQENFFIFPKLRYKVQEINSLFKDINLIVGNLNNKKAYNFIIENELDNKVDVLINECDKIRNEYRKRLTNVNIIINRLKQLKEDLLNEYREYRKIVAPIENLIMQYGISSDDVIDDMIEYFFYKIIKEIDKIKNCYGFSKQITSQEVDALIRNINFNLYQLTNDQVNAIKFGVDRLNLNYTTNLLLQGDVSCGKTIVVIALMILLVQRGYKVCLIAPRKSLRVQHVKNIKDTLKKLNYDFKVIEELTDENYQDFDILVKGYSFSDDLFDSVKIDVCFMDEIQLFGVEQRNEVQLKYPDVDMIFTTATPQPRTKLISLLGDMDIFEIKEKPPGRIPKITKSFTEFNDELKDLINEITSKNEIVIVICPLVNKIGATPYESLKPATEFYKKQFPNLRVVSIGGNDSSEFKDKVISECNESLVDILVASKVIEVGIDIPKASLIIIHYPHSSAVKWGMSQLHQLRGRVGRARQQGYCYIEVPEDFDTTKTDDPINSVLNTEDVFLLTEKDFNWRGFESIIGIKQRSTSGKNNKVKLEVYEKIIDIMPQVVNDLEAEFINRLYDNLKKRKVVNIN